MLAVTMLAAGAGAQERDSLRVVISVEERRLWVLGAAGDTVYAAPVAVGSGGTVSYAGRSWTFATPRGVRTLRRKEAHPLWKPPDWFYAEAAAAHGLSLAKLTTTAPARLRDGRRLAVRDSVVGLIGADSVFDVLPADEHIVFDGTLFIPPFGTRNREVPGELGRYRLDLGDGYFLHGTPYARSIGTAATHGCIRLHDEDIAWLYERLPVGARVEIR